MVDGQVCASESLKKEKMNTVDIAPSPRVLRMLGQIDFAAWQCLAELTDNSIDSFIDDHGEFSHSERRIKIRLPRESTLENEESKIEVEDNGYGMSLEQMKNAVKAGYSGNDPVEKMGLFGMGFNIATARLGRKTEVWSTTQDSETWTGVVIDFDELEKNKTFHAPVLTRPKTDPELINGAHGTLIKVSKLEPSRVRSLIRGQGKAKTRRTLGKIYGRVMRKLNISIFYDGDVVKPWKHCVWDKARKVPTQKHGDVPARIDIEEDLGIRKFCKTCWVWLLDHEEECSACGEKKGVVERRRKITGWIGIQRYFDKEHFGIDLLRNGRVIESLNKSLFTYVDSDGEKMLEYPIDSIHWGGRIVGELEINFVRVSHQKDAFDKLDPEWKFVVSAIRGSSPLQPKIAQKRGFAENKSPLSRLFSGYRKTKAGLKCLVPGNNKGQGVNSSPINEYVQRFHAGEGAYQSDVKWYELVQLAEKARAPRNTGSKNAEGDLPVVTGLPEVQRDEAEGTENPVHPETTASQKKELVEQDKFLSRSYTLPDLPGQPTIGVVATKTTLDPAPKRAFSIDPAGNKFAFKYNPQSEFFENSLDLPQDYFIIELAHHMQSISGITARDFPVSHIAQMLRKAYFKETLTDISSTAERSEEVLTAILKEYIQEMPDLAPIETDVIPSSYIDKLKSAIVRDEPENANVWEEIIHKGSFPRLLHLEDVGFLIKVWPQILSQSEEFNLHFEALGGNAADELRDDALQAISDVIWLWKRAGSTINKDGQWRILYTRSIASLELVETWSKG